MANATKANVSHPELVDVVAGFEGALFGCDFSIGFLAGVGIGFFAISF
jgi:hypothetical protein